MSFWKTIKQGAVHFSVDITYNITFLTWGIRRKWNMERNHSIILVSALMADKMNEYCTFKEHKLYPFVTGTIL